MRGFSRKSRRIRPALEILEDRWLLSCSVIGGYVYIDANDNGLFDIGETPIAGSTMELRNAAGTVVATAVSDSAGYYEFNADATVGSAAIESHTLTFDEAKTNTQITRALPKFNAVLGTLTSIEILVDGYITSDISVENVDDDPMLVVGNVAGKLTLSGPQFSTIVTTSTQAEQFNAQGFDGTIDFAGTSGTKLGAETVNGSTQVLLTNPGDLAAYTGAGTVSLKAVAQATSSATGGGNLVVQISSKGGSEVVVIYHYTPDNCLQPGNYTIIQNSQPAGYFDNKESQNGVVLPGSVGTDQIGVTLEAVSLTQNNFGEIAPAGISGSVYADANDNGQIENGEQGIANVSVRLTGVDHLGQAVDMNALTAADGSFVFKNLRPGMYQLSETQPTAYLDGTDTPGSHGGVMSNDQMASIALPPGAQAQHYWFGELRPASLSGFVYVDRSDNGIKDTLERGIANVLVRLSGIDDLGNAISIETRTATDGSYHFRNLRPGLYIISEEQPATYRDGKDTPGTLGVVNSAAAPVNDQFGEMQLNAGDIGEQYNFGELPPLVVGTTQTGSGKISFTGANDPRRLTRKL